MSQYYLAVDIGASSGRHILASMENGKIVTEEVYRFANGQAEKNGHLCWDAEQLFKEIKAGMKKCAEIGKIPVSMGIDTWAVDFVLLGKDDNPITDAVGYRDSRTNGMDEKVYEIIPEDDLYARTGIQKQIFNTIYQLMAVKVQEPETLANAATMLMIPDYFHFLLTGKKAQEYTNASTTQLISPATKDWDWELIDMLGFPRQIFLPVAPAGTTLGGLTEAIQAEVGYNCQVVLPATHDTGSAVLSVPSNDEDVVYISSGTWSLMGVERMEADCSPASKALNFTNEGGYEYRYRYLKNIMGLWMIQSVKKEYDEMGENYSFGALCDMAEESSIASLVDCNDDCFFAPASMRGAVADFCKNSGQAIPETPGDFAKVIYRSLAKSYGDTINEIEKQRNFTCGKVHIVGGGSNADYLNRLVALATGKKVYAGPSEATAIGNMLVQMLAAGEWANLTEARCCIFDSFGVKEY